MSDFGYKGLRVRSLDGKDPYLISPWTFVPWEGRPPTIQGGRAVCTKSSTLYGWDNSYWDDPPPSHDAPQADCSCGIYMTRTFESCVENMGVEGDMLWTVVVTSGKHIESEGLEPTNPAYNVVRVEKAFVASIIPPSCMRDNHMSEYLREQSGGWTMQYLCKTCKELYTPNGTGRIFSLDILAESWGVTVLWEWWDKVRELLVRPKTRWDDEDGYIFG